MKTDKMPLVTEGLTQYLFDVAELQAMQVGYDVAAKAKGLPFVELAANSIARNLVVNPLRYLCYGPYWWAVKDILASQGFVYGDDDEGTLLDVYCVKIKGSRDDALTLIAADTFKQWYDENYFSGNSHWFLGEDGQNEYYLLDEDMERLAP